MCSLLTVTVRSRYCIAFLLLAALCCAAGSGRCDAQDGILPFPMPAFDRPRIPARVFDIRAFGAREGGTAKVTAAIARAIRQASRQGGGTVLVPAGTWLTGAIHLESNINLHLVRGARLLFSQDTADYLPVVFSRHEDIECYKYSAFIYARGKRNLAITGEGTLDGQGRPWWAYKTGKKGSEAQLNEMARSGVPVEQRIFDGTDGRALRPAFFQPMECTNVLVEGVTFRYGAFWTITPTYCDTVTVRKVTIVTEGEYGHTPNGDGVDPSSCRFVRIDSCTFDTGDDCIAIKAGRDRDGLRVNRPSENIVIRDCRGLRGHGGIVIGSETAGSIRNVVAERCWFTGTDRVVRIKSARGRGGVIENMWFRDLTGEEIRAEALHINMLYTGSRLPASEVSAQTPRVRNIHYSGIRLSGGASWAIEVLGLPELPAADITFTGIRARTVRGVHLCDAVNIALSSSAFTADSLPLLKVTDGAGITLDSLTLGPATAGAKLQIEGERSRGITIRRTPSLRETGACEAGPEVAKDAIVQSDTGSWSSAIAGTFLVRHPGAVTYDPQSPDERWNYEQGLMLLALCDMWRFTGDRRYVEFVRENLDHYVDARGSIRTYRLADYNLDNIGPGRALLEVYGATGAERYRRAADTLRLQLRQQPRTREGGFWHKKIYPFQMWLDGLFMAQPFLVRYALQFREPDVLDDVADQFVQVARHTRDTATGLLYHAWDESRTQRWADPVTGRSPHIRGRALGWYLMALADVLEVFPAGHPRTEELRRLFADVAAAVLASRDSTSALWYQVIDQGRRPGNYLETSASCMFAYAFARGARAGWLDRKYLAAARETFQSVVARKVTRDAAGGIDLHDTCRGAGLGGNPYRDGSFAYYIGEPTRTNDLKGLGAFLRAAIELERSIP